MKLLKSKRWVFVVCSFLLLGAIPFVSGPGLSEVHPIGLYLNGKFPSVSPTAVPYEVAFPNLTFNSPLTFAAHPTQNIIVLGQRDGQIYWFQNQEDTAVKNLMLDLSNEVGVVWDGGFLGLALHPKFGTNGGNYFYAYYTTKDANGNNYPDFVGPQNCNNAQNWGNYLMLVRYEVNAGTMEVIPNSKTTLIKIRMYSTGHRGGGLLFGTDGFLYLTTGDQQAFSKAQDIVNNLEGGVLRIDVDKDPLKSHAPLRTIPEDIGFVDEISGIEYWIPNDNPFLSSGGSNFEEYFSMGHRSPHRMTMDAETGKLYLGELGGNLHDEIDVVVKGKNFGWPVYEGKAKVDRCGNQLYNNMPHEAPLVSFPRADANSLTGGFVYRGTDVPELVGKYICADYGDGEEIWSVNIETGSYELLGSFEPADIISFGEDQEGEIYMLKLGPGNLFKLTRPKYTENTIPQWLSETAAFNNLTDLTPSQGIIPYDLIESFWSDGAAKKRWMAIPNDGSYNTPAEQIKFSENEAWLFPVGTVLIKHFELPIDENDPNLTKRLETRFSVKAANGKFYFVTYKWNEEQTDAYLLSSGLDEDITIVQQTGGNRRQKWHYPSAVECVSCHNNTSGGSLGPRTRYLNNSITYQETGLTANQLVTLSSLGILDQSISDTDSPGFLTHVAVNNTGASLEKKARSYMDLNCAYCHRPGTGNRGDFDLRLINSLEETGLITAGFNTSLGIDGESLLSPGDASRSILYNRVHSVDANIMMPPLAKNSIDAIGAALIEEWINQLDPNLTSKVPEGLYVLKSKVSAKAIEVAGASENDGANVHQWEYMETANQQFYIEAGKPGHFKIKASHSGKYLDLESGGLQPGTNVWQWTGNGTDAQEWKFISIGGGYYNIVNKLSGLYLDLYNALKADGTNIKVWSNNGLNAQKWKLERVMDPVQEVAEGKYYLENKINGKVVEIAGASLLNKANVQQWDYREASNQQFYIAPGQAGYHTIRALHSDKFVDVSLGGMDPGTNVWQWTGNGKDAQQWAFVPTGDGYYTIVSKLNGLYLDLAAVTNTNGNNIMVWTNHGGDTQKWKLVTVKDPVLVPDIGEGLYSLENRASGKVMDVANASVNNRANIRQWQYLASSNQQFHIIKGKPGYHTIKASHSDKFIDVALGALDPGTNVWQWTGNTTDAQQWEFVAAGDGYYYIISKLNGLFLDLENGAVGNGGNILVWTTGGTYSQQWKLNSIEPPVAEVTGGDYYLENKASGKVVEIANASLNNRANVRQWENRQASHQKFHFAASKPGYFTVKALHSNKYVDVEFAGLAPGTNVWQWQGNGTNAQEWAFVPANDGYYRMVSKLNGLVLDLEGAPTDDGANIMVTTDSGADTQLWRLLPVLSATALRTRIAQPQELPADTDFQISPNPVRSGQPLITLFRASHSGKASLQVISLGGQVVQEQRVNVSSGENKITVLTDHLPGGIYLVGVWMGNEHYFQRVILY